MTLHADPAGATLRSGGTGPRANPFVGPRALGDGQPLFGRDREIRELRQLVTSERIVLLYSPSGAGKTSLLEAGLRPEMRRQDFDPLPTIRVNVVPSANGNRYLASTLRCLGASDTVVAGSLDDALGALGTDEARNPLLVFDQFEELLNTDWTDTGSKTAFMQELGIALRDRRRFAVIAMREDYIAQLDPYLALIPTRLAARYRLDLLGHDAACTVAVSTAAMAGITMDARVADAMVTDLRRVRTGRGHASPGAPEPAFRIGPYVEPVHLQVVCKRLVDRLPSDRDTIAAETTGDGLDVDASLAGFYDDAIAGVPGATEREARQWCETALVTRDRTRAQTLDGPGADGDAALRHLEERHLVRADERQGTTWFELAHDRLVEPILQSNERFRHDHLSVLERVAPLWALHRPTSLLLSGRDLRAARRWARPRRQSLLPVERELLRASTRRQWIRRVAAAMSAGLVTALLVGLVGRVTKARQRTSRARAELTAADGRAEQARRQVDARRLATESVGVGASDPELAALLALEAARSDPSAATEALVAAAYRLDGRPLFGHHGDVSAVAFSPDGRVLASAALDGTVRLWRTDVRRPIETIVVPGGGVRSIAYSPDGRTIAAGSNDGTVRLFVATDDAAAITLTPRVGAVRHLAFSSDGATLVIGGESTGRVEAWDVAARVMRFGIAASGGQVEALAVAADGTIATGESDWSVHLRRADTGVAFGQFEAHDGSIYGLAFSDDGSVLVSVSADDTGRVVDVASGQVIARLVGHTDDVYAVAVATGLIATADRTGTIRAWDPKSGRELRPPLVTNGAVLGVALARDGCLLASAGGGEDVHLWTDCYELRSPAELADTLRGRVSRELTDAEALTYGVTASRPPVSSTAPTPPTTLVTLTVPAASTTVTTSRTSKTSIAQSSGPAPTAVSTSPVTLDSSVPTEPVVVTTVAQASLPPLPPTQPSVVGEALEPIERRTLGFSVRGTPIVADHRGQAAGNTVVVIGVVHGNRPAGLALTQALRSARLPDGTDLWIVDTMNPDGQADGTRTNSRGVDLNRNFETSDWRSVGATTDTWTGSAAGSEPETKAMAGFLTDVKPQLVVWWDQFRDALVDSSDASAPDAVQRYADVARLPVQPANCRSPSCVGNLSTYVHEQTGASAFVVSLPADFTTDAHVAALLAAAAR